MKKGDGVEEGGGVVRVAMKNEVNQQQILCWDQCDKVMYRRAEQVTVNYWIG